MMVVVVMMMMMMMMAHWNTGEIPGGPLKEYFNGSSLQAKVLL